jgi:hypothetical protein
MRRYGFLLSILLFQLHAGAQSFYTDPIQIKIASPFKNHYLHNSSDSKLVPSAFFMYGNSYGILKLQYSVKDPMREKGALWQAVNDPANYNSFFNGGTLDSRLGQYYHDQGFFWKGPFALPDIIFREQR